MLSDALKTFKKEYEEVGDKLILDSHIPDDGEYIIVSCDSEPFQILDRVHVELDRTNKTIDRTNQYMDFICTADYYSKYLNSNKSIANKNIHSNNYLSFYTRILGVQDENKEKDNKKISIEAITEYYDYFRYPDKKLKAKPKERILYKDYEDEFGEVDINRVNKMENWVKENLLDLIDFKNEQGSYQKSFLRILFYSNLEEYQREGDRYFSVKIYNNNDYNIEIDNLIYGLPDNNINLNANKPFLKNLTRKSEIPHYLSREDVLLQKKLFEYLSNQFEMGKRYIYFSNGKMITKCIDETLEEDFSGIFCSITKGQKEIEIQEYDNIVDYKYNIGPIKFENVLNFVGEGSKVEYGDINTMDQLKKVINTILFNTFLINNLFTEPKDLKMNDMAVKRSIIASRTALFTWFYKGQDGNVWKVLEKQTTELILSSIFNANRVKACERFNLKMALKNYFEGGAIMTDIIEETKETLRFKINNSEAENIQDDKEYYFAVGQLIYYFLSLNKGGNKKLSLANPILNSKTDKRIKEELRKLFIKYNHSIEFSGGRFKNLYSMIASYEPMSKVDQDILIAGYLHDNLIFERLEKNIVSTNKEGEEQ